jgi:hypothetical protein
MHACAYPHARILHAFMRLSACLTALIRMQHAGPLQVAYNQPACAYPSLVCICIEGNIDLTASE